MVRYNGEHCKVYHFTDDTNLLIFNKSLKIFNKLLNIDLKNVTNWLNANKISLNVSKIKLIIFKPKRKPLNGKRLYPTDLVRYLGVKTDIKLNWEIHFNAIAIKLNRANVMLFKVRDFVNANILINAIHIIHYLNSTLTMLAPFGDKILTQLTVSSFSKKRHLKLSILVINNAHFPPLIHSSKIIKMADKVKIENCLFINKYTNKKLPLIFNNWFTFSSMSHNYQTSFASKGNHEIPNVQTTSYGINAFVYTVIRTWSDIQKEMKGVMLNTFSLTKI